MNETFNERYNDSDSNSTDNPSGWEDSDHMAPQIMFIPRQIPGD